MRIPGSPEEVSTEAGRTTLHFITDFYASAHFKLTPEKFISRCDKCFISLPGCNKMSLEGKLTLHLHAYTLSLALQLSTLMHCHCSHTAVHTYCTDALYEPFVYSVQLFSTHALNTHCKNALSVFSGLISVCTYALYTYFACTYSLYTCSAHVQAHIHSLCASCTHFSEVSTGLIYTCKHSCCYVPNVQMLHACMHTLWKHINRQSLCLMPIMRCTIRMCLCIICLSSDEVTL